MITIENSNIVNWDDFPEYICAIVMQTTCDLPTSSGHIMPAGEEITWLLDKPPIHDGSDWCIDRTKIHFISGIGIAGGLDLEADIKELHFKPKPVVKIESKQECYA